MVYQTEGTCCRQIELEVDGDVVKSVALFGRLPRKSSGHCPVGRRDECGRCGNPFERHPLRHEANFVPGPIIFGSTAGRFPVLMAWDDKGILPVLTLYYIEVGTGRVRVVA